MGLILDSSVVIAAERSGQTAYDVLETVGRHTGTLVEAGISVVTVLELAHGIARAGNSRRRTARQAFLDDLLIAMPVYPVSIPIAYRAGSSEGKLRSAGRILPTADLLIGSTALELGFAVATANARHFEQIPDLAVVRF